MKVLGILNTLGTRVSASVKTWVQAMYDDFTGASASLLGRTPDTQAIGSNTWTMPGLAGLQTSGTGTANTTGTFSTAGYNIQSGNMRIESQMHNVGECRLWINFDNSVSPDAFEFRLTNSTTLALRRFDNDVATQVASATVPTVSTPYTGVMEALDDNVKCFINGVQYIDYNKANREYKTNTYAALRTGSTTTNVIFDYAKVDV